LEELTARMHPDQWTVKTLARRLRNDRGDPWGISMRNGNRFSALSNRSAPNPVTELQGKHDANEDVANEVPTQIWKESIEHRRKRRCIVTSVARLKSGKGGKGGQVKSRKQAIAIGLSEARKKGAKVPPKKKDHGGLRPSAESGCACLKGWSFPREDKHPGIAPLPRFRSFPRRVQRRRQSQGPFASFASRSRISIAGERWPRRASERA
jgi:hypothetical protein